MLKKAWLQYLLLASLVFLLYGNTINHGFTLDDSIYISENENVQRGIKAIPNIFSHSTYYGYVDEKKADKIYRPATQSSYAIEISLFGFNPKVHHFFNILYYAGLCMLLYYLLATCLFPGKNWLFSFLTTLLYLVHPIHTEVVSSIKGRGELLSAFLLVLSLILLFRHLKSGDIKLYLASLLTYLVCLFTKESAVPFVLLFPLFLYFFHPIDLKKLPGIIAPYFLCLAIFLLARYFVVHDIHAELTYVNNGLLAFEKPLERYGLTFYILLLYLKLLVFPHPLLWDYSYGHFQVDNMVLALGCISFAFHLVLLTYAVVSIKNKNLASFLILLYSITMILVSNIIIPIGSTMGERFLFLPSFAFCIATVYYAARLLNIDLTASKIRFNPIFTAMLSIILIAFSFKTFSRSKIWESDESLVFNDIKHSQSFRMRMAQVEIFLEKAANDISYISKAESASNAIIKDFPKQAGPWFMKARIFEAYQQTDKAIKAYLRCVELDADRADALNNLGVIYHNKRDFDKAMEYYQLALEADPDHFLAYENIGLIYYYYQDFENAGNYFEKALSYDPKNKKILPLYKEVTGQK